MHTGEGMDELSEHDWLAEQFEANRPHLRAVAYRMLGSSAEADDAVQEAWLRLSRAGAGGVENLGGWLTTVVARVCLDMLRSRKSRREEPLDGAVPEPPVEPRGTGPTRSRRRCWPTRSAWRCWWCWTRWPPPNGWRSCCTTCSPCRSRRSLPSWGAPPIAARQLASRARRRVQGAGRATRRARSRRQREVVEAFLAASRGGDFQALLTMLDPDIVLRADNAAVDVGARPRFAARWRWRKRSPGGPGCRPALLDGAPGAVWAPGGEPRIAFGFTIAAGRSPQSS